MTLSVWWNRLSKAFLETANLLVLTIFFLPSYLTSDKRLRNIGIGVELIYLLFASLSSRYQRRLDARSAAQKKLIADGLKPMDPLNPWLLVVTIAGCIVIFFFGFGKHLLTHPYPSLTHAEGWEIGAIIWTGIFLLYYLFKFRVTNKPNLDKLIVVLISGVGYWLVMKALNSLGSPVWHVFYVWLIGLCLFVIDFIVVLAHDELEEKNRSKASLVAADIPIVVAFPILMAYLWWHSDTENPEVFVSGIVACQLLISNAVFIVTEFGLLRPSKEITETKKVTETEEAEEAVDG